MVKICGLTNRADALAAAAAGADLVGFVFFPASRRCVEPAAVSWIATLPPHPGRVGVFRDQDPAFVATIAAQAGLGWVQLHGEEEPEVVERLGQVGVIKAIAVGEAVDWGRVRAWAAVAQVLFDTASPAGGGTGRCFDWGLVARRPADLEVWLAGGLHPGNVAEAIAAVRPSGVDVASGVERAVGLKDPARMRQFVAAARAAWAVARAGDEGMRRDEATTG